MINNLLVRQHWTAEATAEQRFPSSLPNARQP
jgi:hypothetical protein